MPFPRVMARSDRYWAIPMVRGLSRIAVPLMLIWHVGASAANRTETPVWAFGHGDRVLIPLTYGPRTDWLRNVLAARWCEAIHHSQQLPVSPVEIVCGEPRSQPLPRPVQIFLSPIKVREYLLINVSPPRENGRTDACARRRVGSSRRYSSGSIGALN